MGAGVMAPDAPASRWGDAQARFYAETIAGSDYAERVAPRLGDGWDDFLDIGAGSGALAARLLGPGARWQAVEPQPAMRALLDAQRESVSARGARLVQHACTWQQLPASVQARQLLAANLGATHHEADVFFDALSGRWRERMAWVVAAQAGPSTFCLAGFLPPEWHGADVRPAYQRTLAQLGTDRAPDEIRFADWTCRFVFPDRASAQAHFLDRLALAPGSEGARAVADHLDRHARHVAAGLEVSCPKRSAVLLWRRH